MPETLIIKTRREAASYSVEIGRGGIEFVGKWARGVLGQTSRILVVSNKKIFGLYGDGLVKTLSGAGFNPAVHLIGDGERFKNLRTLEGILTALSKFEISRTGAVLAFGGGVVGDIAGFAASIHLRGVDLLQIPTTLVAMVDSSVGGKTSINTEFGKNLAGAFYQPKGVFIDPNVLLTLSKRELASGFYECIKHGAIAGHKLLNSTAAALESSNRLQIKELASDFESFLAGHISFKASIVAADERESTAKTNARSRKVLNFGHTFAHALEKSTDYKYLKHGEAVGYGILFAAELSKKLGLLNEKVVNLLCDVVHRVGPLPSLSRVDGESVFDSIRHDKKNINDSLQWILLKGIGKPVVIPHERVGDKLVRSTIEEFIST